MTTPAKKALEKANNELTSIYYALETVLPPQAKVELLERFRKTNDILSLLTMLPALFDRLDELEAEETLDEDEWQKFLQKALQDCKIAKIGDLQSDLAAARERIGDFETGTIYRNLHATKTEQQDVIDAQYKDLVTERAKVEAAHKELENMRDDMVSVAESLTNLYVHGDNLLPEYEQVFLTTQELVANSVKSVNQWLTTETEDADG